METAIKGDSWTGLQDATQVVQEQLSHTRQVKNPVALQSTKLNVY